MEMKNNWCSCNGEGKLGSPRISRRALLGSALTATAGVWWLGSKTAWAQASVKKDHHGNVLVVIFQRGGADGLNIIAPYGEDDYYKARPSLAIAKPTEGTATPNKLIDLDGFFGLNPALSELEADYKEGQFAAVHAVGSGDTTHSHFEAMFTMEHGLNNNNDRVGGGWLARHLNMTEGSGSPMRAISLTSVMPDSLAGNSSALAINSLSEYSLSTEDQEFLKTLTEMYQAGSDDLSESGRNTLSILDTFNKVNPADYSPENSAAYPDSELGKALQEVAFLIKEDVGLEVACLDSGGWDSHVAQGTTSGWVTNLLTDLSQAIAAFRKDLGNDMSRVTVVVQTEFGRRVQENSGLGTDHGAGSTMLLLGGGVQGGKVYGNWPGLNLEKLTGPGDLKITTDYRSILWDVLKYRLKNPDLSQVFPNHQSSGMGIITA